jgi:hypothetical protein
MAAKRASLPPFLRSLTPVEWAIVIACWLLLAYASADPLQKQLVSRGMAVSLRDVRIAQLIDGALWVILLPAIFATLDRFPLRRGVWPKHLAAWVAAAFAFGTVHAALALPLIHLLARLLELSPQVLALPELRLSRLALDDTENFGLAVTAYLILQLVHRSRTERARGREVERSLREARLHALAMELQPHFLFNTLNAIAALVRSDP